MTSLLATSSQTYKHTHNTQRHRHSHTHARAHTGAHTQQKCRYMAKYKCASPVLLLSMTHSIKAVCVCMCVRACLCVCVHVHVCVCVCVMNREQPNLDQKRRKGALPSALTFIKRVCLISQPHHTCALQSTTAASKAPFGLPTHRHTGTHTHTHTRTHTHTQGRECPTQNPLGLLIKFEYSLCIKPWPVQLRSSVCECACTRRKKKSKNE